MKRQDGGLRETPHSRHPSRIGQLDVARRIELVELIADRADLLVEAGHQPLDRHAPGAPALVLAVARVGACLLHGLVDDRAGQEVAAVLDQAFGGVGEGELDLAAIQAVPGEEPARQVAEDPLESAVPPLGIQSYHYQGAEHQGE